MSKALEIRTGKARTVELRDADTDGALGVLRGYAIVWNTYSRNLGGFVEQVAPGAADKSLADQVRVMARYNHDNNYLLGTTDGGTLRLSVDGTGLLYEVNLPDTTAGRDVRALAARGDLRYSSFAFHVPPNGDEWSLTDEGFPLRTVRAIQLVDVAPVNDPAYLDSTAGLRSLAARTGMSLDDVRAADAEVIKPLILGEQPATDAQRSSPPVPSLLADRVRRLELARHTL